MVNINVWIRTIWRFWIWDKEDHYYEFRWEPFTTRHNYQCLLSRSFTSTGEGSPWNLSIKVNFRREWERANSLFLLGFVNNKKKRCIVLLPKSGKCSLCRCLFSKETDCRHEYERVVLFFVSAVDSITDMYTVSQLKQKARENPEVFFGITYSFISRLDLDSSVSKVIRTRWWVCIEWMHN